MKRERVQKERQTHKRDIDKPVKTEVSDSQELKDDLDEMLDEIDLVLEENAQEFVEQYVQRGGE